MPVGLQEHVDNILALARRLAETPRDQWLLVDDRLNDVEDAADEFHRMWDAAFNLEELVPDA